jgi:hypothetical protein
VKTLELAQSYTVLVKLIFRYQYCICHRICLMDMVLKYISLHMSRKYIVKYTLYNVHTSYPVYIRLKANIRGGGKIVPVVFKYLYIQKPALERGGGARSNDTPLTTSYFLADMYCRVDIYRRRNSNFPPRCFLRDIP